MGGSNFTQVVKGNSTVKVDSTDYYVLVIANNAGTSPADVLYQFATYSVNSSGESDAAVEAGLVLTGEQLQGRSGYTTLAAWSLIARPRLRKFSGMSAAKL